MVFVQTNALLIQLRLLMLNSTLVGDNSLSGYIVPLADAHFGTRISDCDTRMEFISGFSGSSGAVIVTDKEALLWTDGRYFTQAEAQLEQESWTLMRDGLPDTPTQWDYLNRNLEPGSFVGVDPTLYSKSEWDKMSLELKSGGNTLVAVKTNLVDLVWGSDRPPCSTSPLASLPVEFSGKTTKDKLVDVRNVMQESGAEIIVLTELDEIAWLLNLRGSDLPSASVFVAYAIVTSNQTDLFIDQVKLNETIKNELIAQEPNIRFFDYANVFQDLETYVNTSTGKIWMSKTCNYALVQLVPADRQIIKLGALSLLKAVKNPVEVAGMKNALIRDAAALCSFYYWLEQSVLNESPNLTEMSAADKLLEIRKAHPYYIDTSFSTISGSGSNGAIIHYRPESATNKRITKNDMYLIDAGSLYLDGTTDITRTFHFGTPTNYQRDCYTRVLKGQIAIARAVFPLYSTGNRLDSFARKALWEAGLDYGHGTGHGIGHYLNVHEGPTRITYFNVPDDQGLRENMFTSNEPGYYEVNQFGIRLENIVRIVNTTLEHNFENRGFIAVEDCTFLPYQHKLIKLELLNDAELTYLNNYQEKVRSIVGQYIRDNNMSEDVYNWIQKETTPLTRTKSQDKIDL